MVKQVKKGKGNPWYLPRKQHNLIGLEKELIRLRSEWEKLRLESEELALRLVKPNPNPPIEEREVFLMEESVSLFIDTQPNGMDTFNKLFAKYQADPSYFSRTSRNVTIRQRALFYLMRDAHRHLFK